MSGYPHLHVGAVGALFANLHMACTIRETSYLAHVENAQKSSTCSMLALSYSSIVCKNTVFIQSHLGVDVHTYKWVLYLQINTWHAQHVRLAIEHMWKMLRRAANAALTKRKKDKKTIRQKDKTTKRQ